MSGSKKGPAASTAKGPKVITGVTYHNAADLSTAAELIVLAAQIPETAGRLREACFERLERIMRRHYDNRPEHRPL